MWRTKPQVANNGDSAGMVRSVVMLPGGERFAAASMDGGVRLIDLGTCKLVRKMDAGHSGGALAVAASPDGKQVASCGMDGMVKLHDDATGKLLGEFEGAHGRGPRHRFLARRQAAALGRG